MICAPQLSRGLCDGGSWLANKKSLHDIDLHVAIFRLIIYSRNIYAGMSKFIFILKTWNMDGGPRKKKSDKQNRDKTIMCVYINLSVYKIMKSSAALRWKWTMRFFAG